MNSMMSKFFFPPYYHRENKKVADLCKAMVDEYYKERELLMIQANMFEIEETTITYFVNGLNREFLILFSCKLM